jgi:nitrite reductase/ring-hydroxylating ferredoxin subunit
VGAVGDFVDGAMTSVAVDGAAWVIAREGESFHAFPDLCTHAKRPLSDGGFEGGKVRCQYHGATFDLHAGGRATLPALRPLACRAAQREGDDLYLTLP